MNGLGNDYGGGRGPLEGNDDDHMPDGFATLKGRLDPDLINAQFDGVSNSFFKNGGRLSNRTFDTHRRDIMFSLDNGIDDVYTPSVYGGPTLTTTGGDGVVLSALNGIEELIGPVRHFKDERIIELYVMSKIRILGQAFTELAYDQDGETSSRSFAIRFGGILTKKTDAELSIGEYVRYAIPTHTEFNAPTYSVEEGFERSKIGLCLRPVRELDGATFGLCCYALQRKLDQSRIRNGSLNSTTDSSSINLAVLGRSMETFALVCGMQMVYRLLQYGFLGVAGGHNNMTAALSNGFVTQQNLEEIEKVTWNIEPVSPAPKSGGRKNGGVIFYTKLEGGGEVSFEDWAKEESPKLSGNQIENIPTRSYTSPEKIVAILMKMFKVTDSKDDANTPVDFKIDKVIAAIEGNDDQVAHLQTCKNAFLNTIFKLEQRLGVEDAIFQANELEFGYSTDPTKRLSKYAPGGANGVKIHRRDTYGDIDTAFCNTNHLLWTAISRAVSLQKSMIAGKVTRSGGRHQAADYMAFN